MDHPGQTAIIVVRTMSTKSILLTGGAGYIGSHTAKALAQAGLNPVVLDDLSAGHRHAVKWGPLMIGDMGDEALLHSIFECYQIEAVVHFGAHAYVRESMQDPGKYFYNNVVKSLSLLRAMQHSGVRQIVFSSSCATYGQPSQVPISEDHPLIPANPYGETKLFIERALYWYSRVHDMRSVSLRYFNAAGADPDGEIGEDHHPETHLIPTALQIGIGSRLSMPIYGTDFPTPDGTAIRDFVHVSDLADAHFRALCYLQSGGPTVSLNLGTGCGYSVREVIQAVERVSGRRISALDSPREPGDPAVLVASADRARKALDWQPKYRSLDALIATAWRWQLQNAIKSTGIRRDGP